MKKPACLGILKKIRLKELPVVGFSKASKNYQV
jgi:hypothetical protein